MAVTVTSSLTVAVGPGDALVRELVHAAARSCGRPARPLHLAALLHLPQRADECGQVDVAEARQLITDLANHLPPEHEWWRPAPALNQVRFGEVDSSAAEAITARFHYLNAPRSDGSAYALFDRHSGRVGALCVVAPLDVDHLTTLLSARRRDASAAMVVARVFVFEGMPRNSVSFLLARVARTVRRRGCTDLVTYVNPNMGFTGVSYAASGWVQLGVEPDTTYRYLDSRYITDRALRTRFGSRPDAGYRAMLGARFGVSVMPLEPLRVFWRRLL